MSPSDTPAQDEQGRHRSQTSSVPFTRMAVERSILMLVDLTPELTARAAELMRRDQDHPMDLADATLVALAEDRDDKLIFTLDTHFDSYQLRGRRHLRVVPD